KWKVFLDTFQKIRAEKYDVAIDFQGLIKSSFFTSLTGANYKVGFAEADLRESYAKYFYNATPHQSFEGNHIIHKNLSLLSIFNIYNGEPCSPNIFFSEEDEISVKEELRKRDIGMFYLIHPYAGWKTKQWGLKNYAGVVKKFYKETGIRALISWAPNEYARAQRFALLCKEAAILSFPTTIGKLTALIQQSLMVVGGDSGPLHIADSLQKPIIALYGPTKPYRTGPINPNAVVVYHQLDCSGCRKRNCPHHHINCMKSITINEVSDTLFHVYKKIIAEQH
ncbi:MAG: hypothetical protein A2Y62_17040, partial [Candidatus Fischerbacteria bacterium RBG_13_37_8]